MRSLVFIALLGSFVASTSLVAQSLTEHAAAAAGATIGTAAGKPLGTTLGKIFGDVEKTGSAAAKPRTASPIAAKPAPAKPAAPEATTQAKVAPHLPVGGGEGSVESSSGSTATRPSEAPARHAPRQKEASAPPEVAIAAPIVAVVAPPVAKEPTVEDIGRIQVGATSSDLHEALGAAESTVSIPGDDGHLLEIRQYWSKGVAVGTVRLDNGRVVSVKTGN
jgi:hypothetical protein